MSFPIRTLRPVGNPIVLSKAPLNPDCFGEFQIKLYQSGTAALAAALVGSKRLRQAAEGTAEVILPAYGCPDLISACIHAGVKPVLADLDPDSCWMSLAQIESLISPRTIAIIAVRFLGIAERMVQLKQICQRHGLVLIEDSAQGFPALQPEQYWQGEIAVLSFGRGKPVNLLGGGALLLKNEQLAKNIPLPSIRISDPLAKIRYALKVRLYNLLINPFAYGLATRMPGIKVGDTVYKQLSRIEGIQDYVLEHLNANIGIYKKTYNFTIELSDSLNALTSPVIIDIPARSKHDMRQPLLRYPLLFSEKITRDHVFERLASYGASMMYRKPLPAIEGVPKQLDLLAKRFENAENFADRLLTLPTHSGACLRAIDKIFSVLRETV